MNEAIVYDKFYRGRRLIVKRMVTEWRKWYCAYIELKEDDLKELGDPVTPDELTLNPVFQHFYGEVTFMGYLGAPFGERLVVGFDTAHAFMENVTPDDCLKALKKTADRLENL